MNLKPTLYDSDGNEINVSCYKCQKKPTIFCASTEEIFYACHEHASGSSKAKENPTSAECDRLNEATFIYKPPKKSDYIEHKDDMADITLKFEYSDIPSIAEEYWEIDLTDKLKY